MLIIEGNYICNEKRIWVKEYQGFKALEGLIIPPSKGLDKGYYLINENIS
jgi:hypothetical protein